jgi:hypothetical protein
MGFVRRRDGVVGIVNRPRTGRSGVRIPARDIDFSVQRNVQTGRGTGVLSRGRALSVRGVKLMTHSILVMNKWRCASSPCIYLHGPGRTFYRLCVRFVTGSVKYC